MIVKSELCEIEDSEEEKKESKVNWKIDEEDMGELND